jgi:hypothetical protein
MGVLDGVLASVAALLDDLLLIDTVRIALPAGTDPVLNQTTGQLEYPSGQVLYEGPGAVQPSDASAQLAVAPDATQPWVQETTSRYRLLTPLSAPVAPKDAIVTVIAVHLPANAALIGRSWICTDVGASGTLEAVRRTPLDQNRAPRTTP